MNHVGRLGLLLAVISLLQGTPASAQVRFGNRPKRDYVRIEPDADLQQALTEQLLAQKDVDQLRRLLAQLGQDPDKLKLDPKKLPGVDLSDPRLRKRIEAWL